MISRFTLHGGISFEPVAFSSIEQMPLPDQLTIVISGTPNVKVGDNVLKGQALIQDDGHNVIQHASTSGRVTEVKDKFITIASDMKDLAFEPARINPSVFDASDWQDRHSANQCC